jgi:hypothetical protein
VKIFLSAFLVVIQFHLFSQGFIGKTRSEVQVLLKKYVKKHRVNVDYNEYDSLITFDIRDTLRRKVDYIYVFGKDGKCHTEIRIACEECIQRYLKDDLKNKWYQWIAQNDSVYNSNQSGGLKMERFKQDTSYLLRIMKVTTQ